MIYLKSFGSTYEKPSESTLKITDGHFSTISFILFVVAILCQKYIYKRIFDSI